MGKILDIFGEGLEKEIVFSQSNLQGADLSGANLNNIKNYSDNLEILFELIRRKKITKQQQLQLGQILINQLG